jgi:hypothetical protein
MANERKRGRKMTRGDDEKRFAAMPESAPAEQNLRRENLNSKRAGRVVCKLGALR